ncbi:MAG: ImmA/IrrE family metallo-endopeptidase [Clostridia bacterium]
MALSPSQYARNLRFQLGLSGPVDVMAVADALGVPVYEEELDRFEGCLLWAGEKARILVRVSIRYESRKHFTIAHEFGHFYMPHHKRNAFSCTPQDIARYHGDLEHENEADEFAAEFLFSVALSAFWWAWCGVAVLGLSAEVSACELCCVEQLTFRMRNGVGRRSRCS